MKHWTGILLLALLSVTAAGSAQERAAPRAQRGWLGISYEDGKPGPVAGEDERFRVRISQVWAGSPAARAGVLPGDVLLEIDGRPPTPEAFEALALRLEPGERVQLLVQRNGQRRDIAVIAGERPDVMVLEPSMEWTIKIDSARKAIIAKLEQLNLEELTNLDPLRVEKIRMGDEGAIVGIRISSDSVGEVAGVHADPGAGPERVLHVRRGTGGEGEVWSYRFELPELGDSLPFEAFLMQSEKTQELMADLAKLRQERWEARRSELARERQLASSLPRGAERIDQTDARLVAVRERRETIEKEIERLKVELERASREALRQERPERGVLIERVEPRGIVEVRPLSPFIVGPGYVAGAHVTPITPQLADYFSVERGLLVTEVVPHSLADDAGLLPGDVVVRAADAEVSSREELRAALAVGTGPLALSVIRKGQTVRVTLRR